MARVATLNFHWDTTNFGAVITAYALNRVLAALGHDVRSLDFKPDLPRVRKKPENSEFDRFRRDNLPVTDTVRTLADLRLVNTEYDAFVVGSDQVWNPHIMGWYPDFYFLTFVSPKRRRIAAAASFGCVPTEKFSADFLRSALAGFDALSVREEASAVALRQIGLEPKVLPDPVFGLGRDEWMEIANRSPSVYDGSEVVWYSVNRSEVPKFETFFARYAQQMSGRIRHLDAQAGIENWLKGIARASLVVTDSFHATCFAVLFGKPFLVFAPGDAKTERMRGLLRRLQISGRIFIHSEEIQSLEQVMAPVDYAHAERELSKMKDDLFAYFRWAFDRPVFPDGQKVLDVLKSIAAMRRRVFKRIALLACLLTMLVAKFAACKLFARTRAGTVKRTFRARREELRGWARILPRLRAYAAEGDRPQYSRSLAAYALMAVDDVRSRSTSGGAFSVLADSILADGGLVAGASFDSEFRCRYELVGDRDGLDRLRGTKYVKAELTKKFLQDLGAALRAGRKVLFVGIPCQVAAVGRMFSRRRDQLTLVDLICAGAPSQRYFRRYLDENWGCANVASYEFRSKAQGWKHRHNLIHIILKDGRELYRTKKDDEYRMAMGLRYTQDEGCFRCPFSRPERISDITIGDFWGVPTACDDGRGTSAVLVNTEMGLRLINRLDASRLSLLRKIDPEIVFPLQPALRATAVRNASRDVFLEEVKRSTIRVALEKARGCGL